MLPTQKSRFFGTPTTIALLFTLMTTAATGCSDSIRGPVRMALTGQVTLDEEPLPSGTIRFIPTEGTTGPVAVVPISDGKYSCSSAQGAVVGTYRVEIIAGADEGLMDLASDPRAFVEYLKQNGRPIPIATIPASYNRQSTLIAEIEGFGRQSFDFDLVSTTAPSGAVDSNRR